MQAASESAFRLGLESEFRLPSGLVLVPEELRSVKAFRRAKASASA